MRQSPSSWWSAERATRIRWLRSRRTASPRISTRTRALPEMQRAAVYELMVAAPHVPDDVRYTAAEFALYRAGYDWALVMALRVMGAAVQRHELIARTKRIEAKRRRKEKG